ncbi:MAG: metallophosphoesterase [Anaerovibrio sp.]|nr:metallophosphoesterase [Selenomonadaceae bacterium]MDY6052585.1 metallophosphoesterase [Anaerovibrio sp.]
MDKKIWQKDISRRQFFGLSAGVACSFMFSNLFHPAKVGAAPGEEYSRLVILTDVHCPSKLDPQKIEAIEEINTWKDVDQVVVTGDVVLETGCQDELNAAVNVLDHVKAPRYVLTGNHDFLYSDNTFMGSKFQCGPEERKMKLERFRKAFKMNALYFSKDVGQYHLVYLSPDDLNTSYLTCMSTDQLAWLEVDLEENRNKPTIIFFHGSLEGTWDKHGNAWPNHPSFMAQPKDAVRDILSMNPQVVAWVSGHLHLGVYNESCRQPELYTYDVNQVQNIHNPALLGTGYMYGKSRDGGSYYPALWTKSLYLFKDRIEVRTYDHTNHTFLPELDMAILINKR